MKRLALALLLALAAGDARAQARSPRWGSLELSAGLYRPNIDTEATTTQPFETFFGVRRRARFDLGVYRALYTGFGSLEAGARVGFFQASAHAKTTSTFQDAAATTALRIIPTSLALLYRVDELNDRWHVPLAPYARLALERYNWWVTDGSGKMVVKGATNGWSATGGVALVLDFFDPTLARELDNDTGINHTFLFFEVTKSKVDDFGSAKSWDLSDETVTMSAGLAFSF